MPDALPDAGRTVTIEDEGGRQHRSRIEHSAAENLTLLRPSQVVAGDPLLIGDTMTLSWALDAGAVGLVQVKLTAMRRVGDDQVWDVDVVGEPWQAQRRTHLRVPAQGAITVSQVADEAGSAAERRTTGSLIDVSESALRCSVEGDAIWAARRHAGVEVCFTLDEQTLVIKGRVVNSMVSGGATRREVVVLFDQPVECVDVLRVYVSRLPAPAPG
jgi:hypothetical protein